MNLPIIERFWLNVTSSAELGTEVGNSDRDLHVPAPFNVQLLSILEMFPTAEKASS